MIVNSEEVRSGYDLFQGTVLEKSQKLQSL